MVAVIAKAQVRKVTVGAQLGAIEMRDGRGDLRWLMLRPQVVESTVYVGTWSYGYSSAHGMGGMWDRVLRRCCALWTAGIGRTPTG